MVALEEAESPLKFSELLDFAVSLLKEKGAEFVTFELSPLEKELLEGEQQKSAKEFSKSVYYNLRSMKTINENFTCHHC